MTDDELKQKIVDALRDGGFGYSDLNEWDAEKIAIGDGMRENVARILIASGLVPPVAEPTTLPKYHMLEDLEPGVGGQQ